MLSQDGKELLTNKGIVIINADDRYGHVSYLRTLWNRFKPKASVSHTGSVQKNTTDLPDRHSTIIVVGSARGGTSIVSGALSSLGVFMGDNACAPVFEDSKLASAFESKDYRAVNQIIADYNAKHTLWGFKRPAAISYLSQIHSRVSNPKYIFIFKDVLAIGNRDSISMRGDLLRKMEVALKNYQKIMRFIRKQKPSAMLVSSEKILQNKAYFLEELCTFLDLQPDEDFIKKAEQFVQPNPTQYLDTSRITKAIGVVDLVEGSAVSGWAALLHDDQAPVLEVYLNEKLVSEVVPKLFRQDLLEKGIHKTGHAGFHFNLDCAPDKGDVLRIRAKYDVQDLFVREF